MEFSHVESPDRDAVGDVMTDCVCVCGCVGEMDGVAVMVISEAQAR